MSRAITQKVVVMVVVVGESLSDKCDGLTSAEKIYIGAQQLQPPPCVYKKESFPPARSCPNLLSCTEAEAEQAEGLGTWCAMTTRTENNPRRCSHKTFLYILSTLSLSTICFSFFFTSYRSRNTLESSTGRVYLLFFCRGRGFVISPDRGQIIEPTQPNDVIDNLFYVVRLKLFGSIFSIFCGEWNWRSQRSNIVESYFGFVSFFFCVVVNWDSRQITRIKDWEWMAAALDGQYQTWPGPTSSRQIKIKILPGVFLGTGGVEREPETLMLLLLLLQDAITQRLLLHKLLSINGLVIFFDGDSLYNNAVRH